MKVLKSWGLHRPHLAGAWRKALAVVALVVLVVGLIPQTVRAVGPTPIYVHTVTDLMNAVTTVNQGTGAYAIILDPGTYTLTSELAIGSSSNGDVTIVGAGGNADGDPAKTIIDGGGNVRVFNIDPSASHPFSTTIQALTVRNGHNTSTLDPYGGGLSWDAGGTNGALTIYNCVFTNNTTDHGDGGGLVVTNAHGMDNWPDTNVLVKIQKSVIKNNTAYLNGGGITVYDHTPIQITDSTIALNSAPTAGGIYVVGPEQTSSQSFIKRSVISGNQATKATGGDGGGLYDSQLPLSIVDTTISGNSATRNGGGLAVALSSGRTTTLTNVTIADNHANTGNQGGAGGGISKSVDPGSVVLQNTIVAQNYLGTGTSTASDIKVIGGVSVDGTSDYNLVGTGGTGGLSTVNHNKLNVSNPGLQVNTVQLVPGDPTSTITKYYTLLAGSPALDGGGSSYIAAPPFDGPPFSDQLGVSRLYNAAGANNTTGLPDIGAVEQFASVSVIANQTMLQDTSSSVSFAVGDTSVSPTVTATSDNQTILPNGLLSLNPGVAGAYTLWIAPAGGKYGTVHVTVTASATVSGITQSMASTFTLTVVPRPDLTVTKSHVGSFTQGQTGATYTIQVRNVGPGATDGSTVTVTDTLPANLTATAISGTGWSCTLGTLTCTRSDVAAPGSSYPDITLTVNVSATAPASVTNNVGVSGGADNTPGDNSATDPTTIIQLPDLTIAKSHTGNFAQGQSGATYTLTVTNIGNGPTTGQAVSVVDALPSGLTATAMSGTGWSCTVGTVTCTRSDVLNAHTAYPDIIVTVTAAPTAGASVTNNATVSGGGEIITNNDSASDTTTIVPKPNLTLAMSDSANFRQGLSGTYTLTVSNAGGADTSGAVTVTDTLPAGLTATTATGTGWDCTGTTPGALSCTRSDVLTAGQSYPVITLTVGVAPNTPASVTNTANVAGGGELYTADDSASRTTAVTPMPDLTITQTHTGNFKQGQQGATYTINVPNVGGAPTDGSAVTVTGTLPSGLTAVGASGTGWNCTGTTASLLSCTRSDALAAGQSYAPITLTVNVDSNASASLTNTVQVAGGGEVNTSNDTFSDLTTVDPASDLTVTSTHTGNFKQGQQGATYTLTVKNIGGLATSGAVTITGTLPTGLTAAGASGTGWDCTGTTASTLSCTRSDALASSQSYAPITLTVNVASNAPASLTNTVQVAGGGEVNTTNNTASDPTTVDPASDLTVTSTHTGHFKQGQQGATYTLTVNNIGGLVSSGAVTVTGTLPTGLAAAGASGTGWDCTGTTASRLSCTRSDALNPGASYPAITLTVNVASTAPASLTNTVQVAGGGEVNTSNDTASDATLIDLASDLTVTSSHAGHFKQGQQGATYTLTVNNIGGLATSGVVTITGTLPTGLTATSASGTGWDCTGSTASALSCTRSDTLASSQSYAPITLTVNVASNAPASVTNTVQVAGGGEVNTSNDTFSDPTIVDPASDLTVTSVHTGNFKQGQQGATYTLTVNNIGGLATSGAVTITGTLPTGLTATSASGTGWDCTGTTASALSCTRSDALASSQSYAPITLTVNVASNAPASLTNTVQVAGGGEVNTSNDTFSDPTTVDPASDLTVTSAHTGHFKQGQQGATYTLTANNIGGLATSGTVTVTDTLPSGVRATGISGTGWTCDLPTLTCTRSDVLNPGASYPGITLTVNVASNAPASLTNQVQVAGGGEVNTTNDTSSDATIVDLASDLTVTSSHAGHFKQGQQGATYTLTVNNIGGLAASGTVTVTDTLPSGVTATGISGSGWTCDLPTLTCTRSDLLNSGASSPAITLTVNVASNAPASLTNQVQVAGGGEINTSNNTAADITIVDSTSDLTVTSTHTGHFKQGQQGATYTLMVNNIGGLAASGTVTVTDTLPSGVTATGISGTGWTCDLPTLTCTRSDALNPGASYPAITLTVNVASNAPASLSTQVQVAGGGEVNTSNDTAADTTTVDPASDLTVTSTHTGNFRQGQHGATYTLTVNNIGGLATSGPVTASDTLPSGVTATGISGRGWTCDLPTLTCTRSDALNPGGSYPTITITGDVAANAPASITNQAGIAGGGEINLSNDSASDTTAVTQVADLTITLVHQGSFQVAQRGATYTLTVSNVGLGPTDAPVTVSDALPTGLKATGISGTGWTCDLTSLTCTRSDSLAPAASYPPITLTVLPNVATNVTNPATVSGGGELNLANDTASDQTTIVPLPVLYPLTLTVAATMTHDASITVSGTAGPGATVTVGGVTVQADAAGNWSAVVSLQEGPNRIMATSNGAAASVTVVRKTTPPTLRLTASATRTTADTAVLTATSDPDTTITIAGQPVSTLTVQLHMGDNIFTATATDKAGNTTTASVTVTRIPPDDGQGNAKPPVTVDVDPSKSATVSADQVTIYLPPNVSDAQLHIKVQSVAPAIVENQAVHLEGVVAGAAEVTAFKDNTPVHQLNRFVTLTFTYDPTVVQQPTKLQIFYFDPAGQAWVKLGGTVDTNAHTITVQVDHFTLFTVMVPNGTVPQIDALPQETAQPDLTVTGTALPSATVSLVVNGVTQSTGSVDEAGRFTLHGTLATGSNQVYVKDNSNLASVSAIVTYHAAPAQPNFGDIQGHWAAPAILRMAQLGIVAGYADNTFRPQAPVTRVQFAVMLARLLKLSPVSDPLHFTDSDQIPAWAQAQVAAAVKAGIIAGRSDGSFDSNAPVTRAEVTTLLVRAVKYAGLDVTPGNAAFADGDQIPAWARDSVSVATRYRLVSGYEDSTFRAGNTATRAEAVAMLSRLLDLLPH